MQLSEGEAEKLQELKISRANAATTIAGVKDAIQTFIQNEQIPSRDWIVRRDDRLVQTLHEFKVTVLGFSKLTGHEVDSEYQRLMSEVDALRDQLAEWLPDDVPEVNVRSVPTTNRAKLPKVEIPTFNGKVDEWVSFAQLFIANIDSDETIGDAVKLSYLKGYLKDKPLQLIQGLEIIAENYAPAWEILRSRYDNERVAKSHYFKVLLNLPEAKRDVTSLDALLNKVTVAMDALRAHGVTFGTFADEFVAFTVLTKLDFYTRNTFETTHEDYSLEALKIFLQKQIQALESIGPKSEAKRASSSTPDNRPSKRGNRFGIAKSFVATGGDSVTCGICGATHYTGRCEKLYKATVHERAQLVRNKKLCMNCLDPRHVVADCTRKESRCRKCNKLHHTLLHFPQRNQNYAAQPQQVPVQPVPVQQVAQPVAANPDAVAASATEEVHTDSYVLLRTAIVQIEDAHGNLVTCRALLDGGSQPEFVTAELVRKLGFNATQAKASVSGIGCISSTTIARVSLKLYSQFGQFCSSFSARVIDLITSSLPHTRFSIDTPEWEYAMMENLADPNFNCPGSIDLLLGGRVMSEIAMPGFRKGPIGYPTLFRTMLGWSIGGPVPTANMSAAVTTCHALDDYLPRFWQSEEIPEKRELTQEEQICEEHFRRTHTRLEDGRFCVDMPLRKDRRLGESRLIAFRQFLASEKRGIPEQYRDFMREYEALGHMSVRKQKAPAEYYLPHHSVFKDEKIRVVFNASSKTSSGYSFNDLQYTGPVVQRDIFQVLLLFRTFKYVFTCDIQKMYRQIRVVDGIREYQTIFWRNSPDEEIKEYVLETVTYGTTSASYLATKCLLQLADEERNDAPIASKAVKENSYMDDICTGANDIAELQSLRIELVEMLDKAGLKLAKWQSNCPRLLATIPEDEKGIVKNLNVEARALGLEWRASEDVFAFGIRAETKMCLPVTKRKLLSRLARVFDPLGLISPVVVTGKYLVQLLWYLKKDWDEPLTEDQIEPYTSYIVGLEQIRQIAIPRYLQTASMATNAQLIGFADASEIACAAAVYMRVKASNGFHVNLICAKTKIASLKKKLTIPRLELNAAVLVAKLVNQLADLFNIAPTNIVLFTDSMIVLAWIQKSPAVLKTFVANRVSRIQSMTPVENWHHVASEENAADLASRGCSPAALAKNSSWWFGPEFLSKSFEFAPKVALDSAEVKSECREMPSPSDVVREPSAVLVNTNPPDSVSEPSALPILLQLIHKISSFDRLINVVAFCLRFCNNSRKLHLAEDAPFVTFQERNNAISVISRAVQLVEYRSIVMSLYEKRAIPVRHPLSALNPFLDDDGVLRVGGRLSKADIPYAQKHPIIIPAKSKFAETIVRHIHQKYLHPGPSLTAQFVRMRFWLCPGGRSMVRKVTRSCVNCLRYRKIAAGQIMGTLPVARVREVAPFTMTGVDYAGPINIAQHNVDGKKIQLKAYIAVFVCFATKAVHIELATDLSMDTFLAAFRRFIARRGVPFEIWSDNGTNFTAAANELQVLYRFQKENFDRISRYFAAEGIRWRFIPPRTPHFGGLWESTVKSVKTHLRVMLGTYLLSYEELQTLLIQIEGCLNSRPLVRLEENSDNLDVLTPGHFLVGRPVLALPDPAVNIAVKFQPKDVKERWRLLQHIFSVFWRKYKIEYLSTLQRRTKWKTPQRNLEVGDIVLLKEYSPPADWSLAKIVQLLPDDEGNARLVRIKIRGEEKTVHVNNVIPLLAESEC